MEPSAAGSPPPRLAQPRVAYTNPIRVHVLVPPQTAEACGCGHQHVALGSTISYCTCGRSTKQPFCDGVSHANTPFLPHSMLIDKPQRFLLFCACKRTSNVNGLCDGSHIHLTAADLEW